MNIRQSEMLKFQADLHLKGIGNISLFIFKMTVNASIYKSNSSQYFSRYLVEKSW